MKIGIIGLGFVGQAINEFFKSKKQNVLIYDKYKNINTFDIVLSTDIIYICLPTLYSNSTKTYDMTDIDSTIEELVKNKYNGVILIKSTVLPNYCTTTNNKYPQLMIVHNPEFLSTRTASHDFSQQYHIVLGYTKQSIIVIEITEEFYRNLFPTAEISCVISEEAGLMKLACNSFYAMKIQYFTEIFLLCEKMGISYNCVKNLMLKNNWINSMHTSIPGHDNIISFGGACFPKDINALNEFMKLRDTPSCVIESVINERNSMRDD